MIECNQVFGVYCVVWYYAMITVIIHHFVVARTTTVVGLIIRIEGEREKCPEIVTSLFSRSKSETVKVMVIVIVT